MRGRVPLLASVRGGFLMFNPGGYDDGLVWQFANQYINAELVTATAIVAVVVGIAHLAISSLRAIGDR